MKVKNFFYLFSFFEHKAQFFSVVHEQTFLALLHFFYLSNQFNFEYTDEYMNTVQWLP